MRKHLLFILFGCLLFSCRKQVDEDLYQQQHLVKKTDSPEFNKLYGGSSEDYLGTVIPGNTGGFVIIGETYSSDGDVEVNKDMGDIWIVKVDEAGKKIWQKTYGGSNFERAISIAPCVGGYLVVGRMYSTDGDIPAIHGDGDGFVLSIDENGNLVNQKTFGGSDFDEITAILPDGNGNYILAGGTNSIDNGLNTNHGGGDIWVIKIDAQLNMLWQKDLGGSDFDAINAATVGKDGSCIVTGFTASNDGDVKYNHGEVDFWVVKLSANGGIIWEKTYGGTGSDLASSITGSVDGGYLVAGLTTSSDGDVTVRKGGFVDAWMIKVDKEGGVKWDKTVGGSGFEQCTFSTTTHNGDFLVGGVSTGNDGDFAANKGLSDGWIMRLDKQGHEKWIKVTGGSSYDRVIAACAGPLGNLVIGGTTNSNDGDVTGNHGGSDFWLFTIKDK